ncbi:ABC transporter permease [Microbacterium sp. gxy059]|uniref:ABC transporter permease n=1 Tax=Microbacterium sp. gxy059 TaxID=2957199 RepID=UPI003D99D62A
MTIDTALEKPRVAEDPAPERPAPPPVAIGRRRRILASLRPLVRRPGFLVAAGFVLLVVFAAAFPSALATHDPTATEAAAKLAPPSGAHWFGTDEIGRDLFSRVVHGTTLSVQAALLAVLIAVAGGVTLGVVAGFAGGRIDAVLMRVVDVLLAIPGLLLALAIITAIGFGTVPVAVAVGVGIIPGFARTTRAEVLRVKTLPYVEAARLGGASWPRVLVRHILPNSWAPVSVLAVLDFGSAILVAAGLSFLGFGAAPPAAELGTLIANGRTYLMTAPWVSLLPGLFLVLLVFAINHVSRTLEEVTR